MSNMLKPAVEGHLRAVLGPTNTGKTHLAVERMLGHASGIIGLPLRLLAREIYDRVVSLRGADCVALVTGEEKIVPDDPAYFVCTVEAMPLERGFDFVAIDEIQLAADPERGHVFTNRLLNARGRLETMLLGADSMRGILRRLLPGVACEERPRFSNLKWSGARKLSRLPWRSAIVAFSAADVYAAAEMVRRQRGGAAVVMGALSPRTRNAQVAMFEAGEVDYLVATDAIGMGLNLSLDHVAFAALEKFDGRLIRPLAAAEIAQIAGRAGRHMRDGTFGVTGDCAEPELEIVERVEQHRFRPVRQLYWRNADPDLSSPTALLLSLERPPPGRYREILMRPREGDDLEALKSLLSDAELKALAKGPEATSLLWQVCQVPDFRKTMAEAHVRLLARLFRHLAESGRLPTDWVAGHLERLERVDGDIDTLATRLAHIRTWTFVAHRADWLDDAAHWQERSRLIEDRLSDALHLSLAQRFVDQRTAALMRRRGAGNDQELLGGVDADGRVSVEGHDVGRMEGFQFKADGGNGQAAAGDLRTLRTAAGPIAAQELARRVLALEQDNGEAIQLGSDGRIIWRGQTVARLSRGKTLLRPAITLFAHDLEAAQRRRAEVRLEAWIGKHIAQTLRPLIALEKATAKTPNSGADAALSPTGRGLAFQLVENLGVLRREAVADQVHALSGAERHCLRRLGVRIASRFIFLPGLLKPKRTALSGLLWSLLHTGEALEAPPPGLVSLAVEGATPEDFHLACGFQRYGIRAYRIDMIERLADRLREAGEHAVTSDHLMLSLVGCNREEFVELMKGLGYRLTNQSETADRTAEARFEKMRHSAKARERKSKAANRPTKLRSNPDSPFADLKKLVEGDRA